MKSKPNCGLMQKLFVKNVLIEKNSHNNPDILLLSGFFSFSSRLSGRISLFLGLIFHNVIAYTNKVTNSKLTNINPEFSLYPRK